MVFLNFKSPAGFVCLALWHDKFEATGGYCPDGSHSGMTDNCHPEAMIGESVQKIADVQDLKSSGYD